MKKPAFLLSLFLLASCVNAQVKQNEKGLYALADGTLFTGTLENKENGMKQSSLEVKDGLANGEVKYFYASGKIMETGYFSQGQKDGKWLRYNEAGATIGLATYSVGKKNGTWIVWDDAGNKRFEMHYYLGEKTGTWLNWDEKGELVSSKDFSRVN